MIYLTQKIYFFLFFFFCFAANRTICQDSISKAIPKDSLQKFYSQAFTGEMDSKKLQIMLNYQYPNPADTSLYLFLLGEQKNSLYEFYSSVNNNILWTLGFISAISTFYFYFLSPLILYRKFFHIIYLLALCFIFWFYRNQLIYQKWVALPSLSTFYLMNQYSRISDFQNHEPLSGLVLQEKDFWYFVKTEKGNFWIPKHHCIPL